MKNSNQIVRDQEEQATRGRASILGVPYIDIRRLTEFKPVGGILNVEEMYKLKIAPLAKGKGQIDFAITINTAQKTQNELKARFQDFNIKSFIVSDASFQELMKVYDPPKEVEYKDISIKNEGNSENILDVSKTLDEVKSDDMVEYIVEQAVKLNASDIHLESMRPHIRMRFRIDGTLHQVAIISRTKFRQLMQSIAIKAGIASSAPDAQTGHMNQIVLNPEGKQQSINMRIETVPTMYGQDAVLRLFTMNQDLLDLNKLGLSIREREAIDDLVAHPHGMVLVVGPTGSGKTTTLYSILNRLNDPTRKIITLEDPVEYGFTGISQIQVNSRYGDSFADKLRAVLRQDPDVIMVGEIRDADTAKTSLQASLTGHLVLSTFHADDTSAAITRLFDTIGGNPMLSSAIKMVIAQRLVRRLDDNTKQEYVPDDDVKMRIIAELADLPEGIEKPNLDDIKLFKPGKSEENPFGFKGRIVIMEHLRLTPQIQSIIHNDEKRSLEAVKTTAKNQGMLTILQDGLLKALKGETTIEEVYKVVE